MSVNLHGDFIKLNDTTPDGTQFSLNDWAEKTLERKEYYRFLEAKARNDLIFENAVNEGIVKFEEIREDVFSKILNANVSIVVGTRITVKEGETIPLDDEFMEFETRFSNDPSVVYRPVDLP
ncbi:hypothetical protein UFOVP257_239 [uncultured Caudovirales phage]|uniref:Uncharacterized protein n=1 Tax=uncultured Caudovirales phage TaxID=2100421 RepID=A0A6J5LKC0_9CAUD|nr:hypothetical protein UFOVP257_239 [uncultured Caudovirales phage]